MEATGPVFRPVGCIGSRHVFAAVIGVAALATLDYSPEGVFVDL